MSLRTWLAQRLAGDAFASATQQAVTAAVATATAQVEERVREAMSVGLSRDDAKLTAEGFRRITSSGELLRRDLQPLAQDQQNRLAYYLWESNVVARWLIETTVDFTLGEGAAVTSEIEEIQAAIDAFWTDGVNKLDERLDTFAREFRMYGELCLPVGVNLYNGHVRLGYVDPLEISDVVTDANNVLITTGVVLKSPVGAAPRVLHVIREQTDPRLPGYGYLMPAEPGQRVRGVLRNGDVIDTIPEGSCFLWQTNKVSNARRGRSDLIADLDWLDALDAYLFDALDAAGQLNQFIWDVKLEGMDEAQIRAWQANQPTPKRGERRAHNEKVTWSAVVPELKAQDKDSIAKLFRGHVIGAHSFPEHFYGSGDGTTFAAAKEMGLPPVKSLSRKQKSFRFVVRDLVLFALHQKIIRGALEAEYVVGKRLDAEGNSTGTKKRTDQCFTVALPELSMRDQSAIVAAMTGLSSALTVDVDRGWIRPETASKLICHVASQLGFDIKPDEEYVAGAGPAGAALTDYNPASLGQLVERIQAQLGRMGKGDGENVGQPKGVAA